MSESPYQLIKRSIADGIATRHYLPGQVLPSEPALCRTFGVARMTVNRAMRELAAEQLVRRVPGVGTFVAEPVAESGLVELRNIADEIAERGHRYSATVFVLAAVMNSGPFSTLRRACYFTPRSCIARTKRLYSSRTGSWPPPWHLTICNRIFPA
jgi:GntR family histidine utilization transcriptional repressor